MGTLCLGLPTVKGAEQRGGERSLIRAYHDRRREKKGFTLEGLDWAEEMHSEDGGVMLGGINSGCAQKGDFNRPWHGWS